MRGIQDPQAASKALVDHALARFSTDNLSCMVIRFDSATVQKTVDKALEPIGVEGDPATKSGGLTESEALVRNQKKHLDDTGEALDRIPSDVMEETGEQNPEPGPELNPEALEAARKDKKPLPEQPSGAS